MTMAITWNLCTINWDAVSAIATAVMAIATFISLRQNNKQLKEMKQQWAEEHQPRVDCSLEKMGGEVYLAIINISNNVATNVEIKITTNVTETQLLKRTIDLFEKTKFVIPPTYKKLINLYIPFYCDGNYDGLYIDVRILINCKVQDEYKMYLNEINLIRSMEIPISSKELDNINKTIDKKKFM